MGLGNLHFFGQLKALATGPQLGQVWWKVVSVLRGSTSTSTTRSRWCEALRLDEINLSRVWFCSSQPWGFRYLFERANGEQVSIGSA